MNHFNRSPHIDLRHGSFGDDDLFDGSVTKPPIDTLGDTPVQSGTKHLTALDLASSHDIRTYFANMCKPIRNPAPSLSERVFGSKPTWQVDIPGSPSAIVISTSGSYNDHLCCLACPHNPHCLHINTVAMLSIQEDILIYEERIRTKVDQFAQLIRLQKQIRLS